MSIRWRTHRSVLAAMLLVTTTALAAPASSIHEATQRLTAGSSKDWIFKRFETILGPKNACKKGEIWTFRSSGWVEIRRCVKGKTQLSKKRWQIQKKSDLDLLLIVGTLHYTILLPDPKPGSALEEMHLRIVSTRTTVPTTDMRFTHERD